MLGIVHSICFAKKLIKILPQKTSGGFRETLLSSERLSEKRLAAQVLEHGFSKIADQINGPGYAHREARMAGIREGSHVLVLGSGALPLTGLVFKVVYGAKCTCVDIDSQAVELGRKIIEKLGLEDGISIVEGDAVRQRLSGYDFILVTTHCMPKGAIFNHIYRHHIQKPHLKSSYSA